MPSLITFDEALAYGRLTDHDEIGALVERAWEVRRENFGDSTDMCSLVNAKSGGCAEDCGFCAQSRYAEADTPMHAMLEPEQILEHAKAAEAAGAHRFCMVTQGQGLSKRDFQKILEGTRLVAEQTNLKRCASIGHMSAERAKSLKDAGVQRVHHNVESSRSYYPEVSSTVRYEGRLRTIQAVKEAGLETCVGGILNLGETEEQRVEMAFELTEINPTSVPINLLNPREGTKFGDRDPMDPWEVVKWVAIFRLIIPGALFRLCGGRVENLGELQPLAVKAGLNGVMMGNFLTTLGAEPEDDRAMFEELGLNVARQPDNGANPRPDNRSGWLDGETPATPMDELIDHQDEANFWDPSTQLRVVKKAKKPPPYPQRAAMTDVAERLEELRDRGLYRRLRLVERPAGPAGAARRARRCCCSARTTTSASPTTRGCASAAAEAALRWGAGAGASRLISGNMEPHRRLESRLAEFKGYEAALLFGSGYLANTGDDRRPGRARARSSSPTSSTTPASSTAAGSRGPRPSSTATATSSTSPGACARRAGAAALIVTDGVFSMDGDVAPLPELLELARRHGCRLMVDEAHATGAIGPGGRGSVAAAGLSGEVDVVVGTLGKALGSYGAYVCAERRDGRLPASTPPAPSSSPPRRRRPSVARRRRRRWSCSMPSRSGSSACRRTPRRLRAALAAEGLDAGALADPDRADRGRRGGADDGALRARARARRLRPGDPPADRARGLLAPALHGDGDPPRRRAASGPRSWSAPPPASSAWSRPQPLAA